MSRLCRGGHGTQRPSVRHAVLRAVYLVVLIAFAPGARAADLRVVDGELVGASDVDVGGSLYGVEFREGTCVDLFNGCDSVDDFTFTTPEDALAASQALVDQVFLDGPAGNFDTDPTLTYGCSYQVLCDAFTPYGFTGLSYDLAIAYAVNYAEETVSNGGDRSNTSRAQSTADSTASYSYVFSVWTPVPEPTTGSLLLLGLANLLARPGRRVEPG